MSTNETAAILQQMAQQQDITLAAPAETVDDLAGSGLTAEARDVLRDMRTATGMTPGADPYNIRRR